jgi:hypothetical protein
LFAPTPAHKLLLLLLLGVDWYADPYQGRSPHSRPLASSEVSLCLALGQDKPVRLTGPGPGAWLISAVDGHSFLSFPPLISPHFREANLAFTTDFVYMFMSIRL